MSKFKLGQKVTYLRLDKVGSIVGVDMGLGYSLDCDGWIWSVPEDALSAKVGPRYRSSRKKNSSEKPHLENPNDSAKTEGLKSDDFRLNPSDELTEGVAHESTDQTPPIAKSSDRE